jgi:toxin ParE1/3/4
MLNIILATSASNDVESIWRFLANQSIEKADLWLVKIDSRLHQLSANPSLGTARNDLAEEMRSLNLDDHQIYYRFNSTSLQILRVLHCMRDPERSQGTDEPAR